MTGVRRYGSDHLLLDTIEQELARLVCWQRFNRSYVVSGAHHEENLVAPCEPIQRTCKRAQGLFKRPIPDANRQVDNCHLRGHWRVISFSLEQTTNSPMDQVNYKDSFRHGLRVITPITWILLKDWADVQRPRKNSFACSQVAMENERSHGRAMPASGRWVIELEPVRIVHDKPSLKSAVRLQRQPIQQRNDRETDGLLLG